LVHREPPNRIVALDGMSGGGLNNVVPPLEEDFGGEGHQSPEPIVKDYLVARSGSNNYCFIALKYQRGERWACSEQKEL